MDVNTAVYLQYEKQNKLYTDGENLFSLTLIGIC